MTRKLMALLVLCLAGFRAVPAGAIPLDMVRNIPGTFVDISTSGLDLMLTDDEETEITTTIGNAILPAGSVTVGINGGIAFNAPANAQLSPDNDTVDSGTAFGGARSLLAFWDDLDDDPKDPVSKVYFQETGGVAIIQYNRLLDDDATLAPAQALNVVTFQIQIMPAGTFIGATEVFSQFLYPPTNSPEGASATVGYFDAGMGNNNVSHLENFRNLAGENGPGVPLRISLIPEPSSFFLLLGGVGLFRRPR